MKKLCRDLYLRNLKILSKIYIKYKLMDKLKNKTVDDLLKEYMSIYVSYEKNGKTERIRLLGAKYNKDKNSQTKNEEKEKPKKSKRETIYSLTKKKAEKEKLDIQLVKLELELFSKAWQQSNNIIQINKEEDIIKEMYSEIDI